MPTPTLPVQQLSGVTLQSFPDPAFLPLFLKIVLHLIQFQDDDSPRGFRLLVVLLGNGPEPVEYRLG